MPQSLAKVYLHIVFSTKNRQPLIREEVEEELHKYLSGIARDHKSPVIAINNVEDHIHLLCLLSRNITISKLLEELKKSSSKSIFLHSSSVKWLLKYPILNSLTS